MKWIFRGLPIFLLLILFAILLSQSGRRRSLNLSSSQAAPAASVSESGQQSSVVAAAVSDRPTGEPQAADRKDSNNVIDKTLGKTVGSAKDIAQAVDRSFSQKPVKYGELGIKSGESSGRAALKSAPAVTHGETTKGIKQTAPGFKSVGKVVRNESANVAAVKSEPFRSPEKISAPASKMEQKKRMVSNQGAGVLTVSTSIPYQLVRKPAGVTSTAGYSYAKAGSALVFFSFGSAELTDSGRAALSAIAKRSSNAKEIGIQAFTDGVGGACASEELSRERALAVGTFLVDSGVERSKLKLYALGQSRTIAENDTPLGRMKNRRVEVVLQ